MNTETLGEISDDMEECILWEDLLQLDSRSLSLIISIFSVAIALLSVFLSVIISLWNVNRQRKANYKNDEEKFKRDLNLKTCDEFLEKLFAVQHLYQNTRVLDQQLSWMIQGPELPGHDFNEALWNIIEDKSTKDLMLFFLKREIVLHKYKDEVERIFQDRDGAIQAIWEFKTYWEPGRTDQELLEKIKIVNQKSESVIELLTELQRIVQNDFLGNIYKVTLN